MADSESSQQQSAGGVADAGGAPGSYSNSAITGIGPTNRGRRHRRTHSQRGQDIARARLSGPSPDHRGCDRCGDGRERRSGQSSLGDQRWICFPGNENKIGNVPMCCDPMGLQWMRDAMAGEPKPTNTAPGLIYMLCGATQHSNTDAADHTSPAIPIGPHWMILWPYDAARDGLPRTVRDAGAWVMFDGTPYAYLHICGTPWTGNEYIPGQVPIWTMRYGTPTNPHPSRRPPRLRSVLKGH